MRTKSWTISDEFWELIKSRYQSLNEIQTVRIRENQAGAENQPSLVTCWKGFCMSFEQAVSGMPFRANTGHPAAPTATFSAGPRTVF